MFWVKRELELGVGVGKKDKRRLAQRCLQYPGTGGKIEDNKIVGYSDRRVEG
jgi:hypothetical protein